MNKGQLIEVMAKDAKISKADATRAFDSMLKNVMKSAKKEPVQIVGFGTFKTVSRKARNGINPKTGQKIKIPSRKVFKFSPSKNPKY
ncbi:MAG: HU family DNA-binding protein [Nanoarchaeota archaeon]